MYLHTKYLSALRLSLLLVILSFGLIVNGTWSQNLPTVNGLFYGDGDEDRYTFLGTDLTGSAYLYYALDPQTKTVYVAAIYVDGPDSDGLMEAGDNVFAWGANNPYTTAAGWNHRNFDHVLGSDHAQIMLRCGTQEYNFKIDLLYNNAMDNCDFRQGIWLADAYGADGDATNMPAGLAATSSMAWNMNHTSWDVDQGGCNPSKDWMSPDTDGDNSPLDEGYPYYNEDLLWEWSTIYEISFDYNFCYNSGESLEVGIWDLHSSPWKPDWTPPGSPLIAYSDIGVLPLDWGHIDARPVKDGILIDWSTFNEHDVSHFEVERSADGVDFEMIGRVEFTDHRTLSKEWEYTDSRPLEGINYYRIRHVDHSGRFSYSPVVTEKSGKIEFERTVGVFPNPAREFVMLRGLDVEDEILISDQFGRKVYQAEVINLNRVAGSDFRLDVSGFAPGMYVISSSRSDVYRQRLIIAGER